MPDYYLLQARTLLLLALSWPVLAAAQNDIPAATVSYLLETFVDQARFEAI